MRVIVKAEDDEVVVLDEALLCLVDRVRLEVGSLIEVVVERGFVRDDEVPSGRRGAAEDVEGRHAGGRDGPDLGFGRSRLERVDGLRTPRDTELLKFRLNARDDLLGRHALMLQYGSATGIDSTRTSGTSDRIQTAHACMPGCSEIIRPIATSPLPLPADQVSSV